MVSALGGWSQADSPCQSFILNSTMILNPSRNGREKFSFKSSSFCQPCSHSRPPVLYFLLLVSIIVLMLLEPSCPGERSQLVFRIAPTFPIVSPNQIIVRPDRCNDPGFEVLRGRTQDNLWGSVGLAQPTENDLSQGVCSAMGRWTRLFARQSVVRCIPNASTVVCLARHISIYLHDQDIMVQQCQRAGHGTAALRDRLTTPAIHSRPSARW